MRSRTRGCSDRGMKVRYAVGRPDGVQEGREGGCARHARSCSDAASVGDLCEVWSDSETQPQCAWLMASPDKFLAEDGRFLA